MPTTDLAINSDTDFFSDLSQNEGQEAQPHLQYLQDSTSELSILNKHKSVKSIFLRYNSTIPSAPIERLFIAGAIILSKRRNRLNDDLFEKLLLLKLNKNFW